MRVGNGSRVDVIAVGMLPLHLPSGLVLNLNNCYLVPALSMNIISGSCLLRDGYSFKSEEFTLPHTRGGAGGAPAVGGVLGGRGTAAGMRSGVDVGVTGGRTRKEAWW